MKTNIKYAVFDLLFYLMCVSLSLVGIIVLLTSDDKASRFSWVTIVFSLFFLFSVIMVLFPSKTYNGLKLSTD